MGGVDVGAPRAIERVRSHFAGWDDQVLGRCELENKTKLETLERLRKTWDTDDCRLAVESELSEEHETGNSVADLGVCTRWNPRRDPRAAS